MANKAIGTLAVGSSVYLNVGGVRKEFLVVHQGLPSSLYDASCDGTWLLMKDCYENRQWNSSGENKYESSTVNTYLNGPFLSLFDSNIQGIIKQVKIPYRKNGGSGGTTQQGANGLPCKIFLLSAPEVHYELNYIDSGEGAVLSYFASCVTNNADSKRVAYLNGSASVWGVRSPYTNSTYYVWYVYTDGNYYIGNASDSFGIRPALILPSTTLVDDSGNVVTVDLTAHKTLVGGTAYTVKGGKCMVNGTVYNILKGRTLIDGTGWDITFPSALTMPVKGDLITMNLDGTDRLYRVLKMDGTVATVMWMWDDNILAFDSGNTNTYAGKTLDTHLNTTWYGTLSDTAKAAIVPTSIYQYQYFYSSYAYNATTHASYANYSSKALKATVGERYVYALDIEDIEEYFGGTAGSVSANTAGTFANSDIQKLFWNITSAVSKVIWLRAADADNSAKAWYAHGGGFLGLTAGGDRFVERGALRIDLSKIDFTIN